MRYFVLPLQLLALALAALALLVDVSARFVSDALTHTSYGVMKAALRVAKKAAK